jgi:UPF0755 protein
MSYARLAKPSKKRHWPKWLALTAAGVLTVGIIGFGVVHQLYVSGLKPVDSADTSEQSLTIPSGATLDEITDKLKQSRLIRSDWAFQWYVSSKGVRNNLQAGTYSFSPSQSAAEIVVQLSHGKVTTDLVTIIPGQRLGKIRTTLLNYGFSEADVDSALDPDSYNGSPVLAHKPAGVSLEGFIYPDSYQKSANTTPHQIIAQALDEMNGKLTIDLQDAFAAHGLSTYEGIILASVVEKEVSKPEDRTQVAQVFLKRLKIGMALDSNATEYYFNSYREPGLPPTPISNVTLNSLQSVAHPASTDWLYFVSGDDGVTHFSKTLAEHEAKVFKYCKKLCGG